MIISKLLYSILNWPKKILISTIPSDSDEAACFKLLIDIEGLVVRRIGLLTTSTNSRGEALNIRPVLKQINHNLKDKNLRGKVQLTVKYSSTFTSGNDIIFSTPSRSREWRNFVCGVSQGQLRRARRRNDKGSHCPTDQLLVTIVLECSEVSRVQTNK